MPLVLPAVPEGCEVALLATVLLFSGTIPARLEVALSASCSSLLWPLPARQPAPDSGMVPASGDQVERDGRKSPVNSMLEGWPSG